MRAIYNILTSLGVRQARAVPAAPRGGKFRPARHVSGVRGHALALALVVLAPDVLEAPRLAPEVLGPTGSGALRVTCLSLGQELFPIPGPLAGVLQVAGGRRTLVPSVLQARALEEVVPERV